MNIRLGLLAAWMLAGAVACKDPLVAENLQSPDIDRVYRQPASIETALGSSYQVCRNNALGTNAFQQMNTMSFETFSSLNNFNMGPLSALPRSPIINTKATQTLGGGTFSSFSRFSRNAVNAIAALDRLKESGGTISGPGADARARAFGFFGAACDFTWLAAMYDSAGIVSHLMPPDSIPPLSGYKEVAAAALALFDSAIAVANLPAATTTGGFPTPAGWMSGKALSKDEFIRLMRSWKARLRTIVPRTKTERDAVDWQAVIADAENGITADLMVTVSDASGWDFGWPGSQANASSSWHQLTMMILGAADVSGAWDTWLATPKGSRVNFVVQTPDLRWPQGATRQIQQGASPDPGTYTSRPYIKNRTDDTPGEPWGTSYYSYARYIYYRNQGSSGSIPEFMTAEIDLIAAEGYIRTGNIAAAAAKIDKTRVSRGGLPALSGVITTATQLLPGANCVPRMVVGPNFNSTTCADIMEAMKYEKRMELLMNHLGAWFFDSRGWQNLYEGTPLMYPVPVTEIDARYPLEANARYYNIGGGGIYSAPRSLLGFEIR